MSKSNFPFPTRLIAAVSAGMLFLGIFTGAKADITSSPPLGSNVTLYATADGSGPFSYQWRKKIGTSLTAVDIAGATGPTYIISNIQVTDAGSYSVVVTNSLGSVTSDLAIFSFSGIAPVFITQPPATLFAAVGGTATFTVVATGGPIPNSFQWKKNGVNLTDGGSVSGAATTSLTITGLTLGDAGTYTVVVDNGVAPAATSTGCVFTVGATAPSFTTQPVATQTVTWGSNVTITAVATGVPTPSYQWKLNGTNLSNGGIVSGATSSTLTLTGVTGTYAGTYTVVADNTVAPAATSNTSDLVVNGVPVTLATGTPASQTVTTGSPATFTVSVLTGSPAPTFQWYFNTSPIAGATASSYSIASAQPGNAGTYSVTVTNSVNFVSASATLTVYAPESPPTISKQPVGTTVSAGHSVTFKMGTTDAHSFQWQESSDGGVTWSNLANNSTFSGVTTNTLTISNASVALNSHLYRGLAGNGTANATSNAVTLGVIPPVFPSPIDVTVASGGNLLVTDSAQNVIQSVSAANEANLLAGSANTQGATNGSGLFATFRQPAGEVLDSAGNLYVADTGNSLIRKITPTGTVSTVAGSETAQGSADGAGTAATFNSPTGITIDAAGNLYVADTGNSTIRKIDTSGNVTTFAGFAGYRGATNGTGISSRFNGPTGIAADSSGNLYVADTLNQSIRRITPAAVVSTYAGLVGVAGLTDGNAATEALFNGPQGITVKSDGTIYVSDSGNSTIRRITAAGVVSTYAGLPTISGQEDGASLDALFNMPLGLRLDGSGNLYVADKGNAAIRRITTAGVVTTLVITQGSTPIPPSTPTNPPTNPTPPTTTPTPPAATPAPSHHGGGAPSVWFLFALAAAGALRFRAQWAGRRVQE